VEPYKQLNPTSHTEKLGLENCSISPSRFKGYFLDLLLKGFQEDCDNSGSLSDSGAVGAFRGDSTEASSGTVALTGMS